MRLESRRLRVCVWRQASDDGRFGQIRHGGGAVLTVGSLFSGIGGFDLGLERAGMRVLWQCESCEFCRAVLERHWPDVPCHPDARELAGADVAPVDVLCAGWPCPGFSVAGRGEGFDHEGSGLWTEVIRLVGELRPRYVVLENVAALLARGLGRVLGDLAALGYDAEWDCLPASAFGAPHRRDRLWLVAYPQRHELRQQPAGQPRRHLAPVAGDNGAARAVADVAHAEGERRSSLGPNSASEAGSDDFARHAGQRPRGHAWAVEPDVGRVADGVPARVDRLRSLGNALVPQIAEWIGRRILEWERVANAA